MAELAQSAALELLRPILDYFLHADERRAVKRAGTLRFWKDGMLGDLEKIRDGKANDETYEHLEKALKGSESDVKRAMNELLQIRDRLGPPLSKVIENIVHNDGYGKGVVRYEINNLLDGKKGGRDVTLAAKEICNRIATLNAELDRLHRLVYPA